MKRDDCDHFTRGFLDCAAWLANDARTGETVEWDSGPADDAVAAVRWQAASIRAAVADCATFQADNATDLATLYAAGMSEARAGHDYFLTRNGYGAGFWDEGYDSVAERRLTDSAHAAGTLDCERYRGRFSLLY